MAPPFGSVEDYQAILDDLERVDRILLRPEQRTLLIDALLAALLEVFGCHRAWLVREGKGVDDMQLTFERTVVGFESGGQLPEPSEGLVRLHQALVGAGGRAVAAGEGNEVPLSDDVTLGAAGWRSQLALTLQPAGDARWLFGLHHCSEPRVWSARERWLLEAIGRRVADALERLRVGQQLADSEARYRGVVQNAGVGIVSVDAAGSVLSWNAGAERIFGHAAEEIIGQPVTVLVPEEQRDAEAATIAKIIGEGRALTRKGQRLTRDGRRIVVEITITPLRLPARERGVIAILRDITGEQQHRRALLESERRYRALFEFSADAIFLARDERFVDCNPRALEMFGCSRDQLIGQPLWRFAPARQPDGSDSRDKGRAILAALSSGQPQVFEFRHLRHDGSPFEAEVSLTVFEHVDGPAVLALCRDISERKRVEAEMRKLSSVVGSVAELVIITDLGGRITYTNRAVSAELGPAPEALVGRSVFDLIVWPTAIAERSAAVRRGEQLPPAGEYHFRVRDGKVEPYSIWFASLTDATGVPAEIIAVARNISEQQRAEQEQARLAEQLRQAQKMEAIGRLAGGVAHDFNNLITGILGYAEMAQRQLGGDNAPVHADLDEIKRAAERASLLTSQLLAFSRKQIASPEVIDLNAVVGESQRMIGRIIGEDVELNFLPAPQLWRVRCDIGQVDQILVNLAVNARDAMPDGGRLTIETANAALDAQHATLHGDISPGDYVMLAVSDSGSGIDAETRERIFEPFFSTKPKGEGTGLGLATVYGIVKQNGGSIFLYSEPGAGTTFKIYLPRVDAQWTERRRVAASPRPIGGTETILLVEDEPTVRRLAQRVLSGHGYAVLEATDGEVALTLAGTHAGPIALLLTDVIMPHLNGRQLFERLRALRPELRVLYMSGYTDNVIAHHGVLEPDTDFIGKPFSVGALATKVREILDE